MKVHIHYLGEYEASVFLNEGQPVVTPDRKDELCGFLIGNSFRLGDSEVTDNRFEAMPHGKFLWVEKDSPAVMVDTYAELYRHEHKRYLRHVGIDSMSSNGQIPGELELFLRDNGFTRN